MSTKTVLANVPDWSGLYLIPVDMMASPGVLAQTKPQEILAKLVDRTVDPPVGRKLALNIPLAFSEYRKCSDRFILSTTDPAGADPRSIPAPKTGYSAELAVRKLQFQVDVHNSAQASFILCFLSTTFHRSLTNSQFPVLCVCLNKVNSE